ncbi:FAD-dependent oxidoreductase [Actinoplanes siamensis]|uniref:Monooxygenase n=1 Tax=Actinoplanes siamensis TaxID=1223317 RepID=A0A919TLD6_9ACTN|nr:FAD-dependent monooxygenase [Actinoplanes siamensis]GIF07071.1 monooxygenase [Actinoplanes siamensis]
MRDRPERRGLRILVAGGGVGGLALAQRLRAGGADVTVFERDPSVAARYQGYRLHISPEGEQALRDCVPPAVAGLIAATANARSGQGLVAYDDQLNQQWAPSFPDPRTGRTDRIDSVDRGTLRHALLAGIEDRVRFGGRVVGHEVLADGGVTVRLAGGASVTGDVLVAADGAASPVRESYPDTARPRDLGIRTIFGRVPITARVQDDMSAALRDRFSYLISGSGSHLGIMPMVFRNPPRETAARMVPGAVMPDSADYYMCVFNVHREDFDVTDDALAAMGGPQLWEVVLRCTGQWHPDVCRFLRHAEARVSFAVPLRATEPVKAWDHLPVVPLGDAVHTMPPSGGVGANVALRDAAALGAALLRADRGEQPLADAVADYQARMVEHATEALAMSMRIAEWSIPRRSAT